jgi:O-antigen/teichoic acid export membrane protein
MIKHLRQLSKDTLTYGLSSALQKFIAFFLFPIYTRLLTKADFGLQDLVMTSIFMISVFLVLGMDSGVMLHYYSAEEKDKEKICSTWLWSELLIALVVCLPLWIFAAPISNAIFDAPEIAPYFRLAILSVPFAGVVAAILLVLRLTFQRVKLVLISTAGVLFQVLAAIIFVVVLRMGVQGVFLALLIGNVLQTLFALVLASGFFQLAFSFRWLKILLVVGIPLVPVALSVWVLNYANRYFLVHYGTISDIGMLSVALRISSILRFAISSFEMAWGPFAYSLAEDPDSARPTYAKVLTYFLIFSMGLLVILSLFAREIIILLATATYEATASLVPILCFSLICWAMLYIVGMGAGIAKKTYHNTVAMALGVMVNILFNFLFIPSWGIVGASAATLGGNVVALVYMYFAGQHYFHVNYEFNKLVPLTLLGAFSIALGVGIDHYFVTWNAHLLLFKAAVAVLFILTLLCFRVVRIDSIRQAWTSFRSSAPAAKCS